MAKTKISALAEKLATDNEPGLSTSQLMLVNHDLKPGMVLHVFIGTIVQFLILCACPQLSPSVGNGDRGIL